MVGKVAKKSAVAEIIKPKRFHPLNVKKQAAVHKIPMS
jgi:hypothetical protein